jgi:hypothetical protein
MLDMEEYSMHYAITCIGQYISCNKKTYLFIDNKIGVDVIPKIAKLCMDEYNPESIIHINSMIIFAEFIKIKGSSIDIIRDVIIPCIPKCMNIMYPHLARETIRAILAICVRDITLMDYFKTSIYGHDCYFDHLMSRIECETGSCDENTASYARQILKLV